MINKKKKTCVITNFKIRASGLLEPTLTNLQKLTLKIMSQLHVH